MCAQVTPPTRDAARPKAPERAACAQKPSWKGRKQKRRRGSARGARGGEVSVEGNALEGECLIRIRCLFSLLGHQEPSEKSRVHPAHKRASRARMPPLAPGKRGTIAGAGEGREEARRERGREQHRRRSSSDRKRKRRPPVSPPRTPRVRSHTETVEEEAQDTITEEDEDDDSEEQVA